MKNTKFVDLDSKELKEALKETIFKNWFGD